MNKKTSTFDPLKSVGMVNITSLNPTGVKILLSLTRVVIELSN